MREIIFRGKKLKTSPWDETDWIYGSLIDSGNHEQVAIYPWVNGASTMSVRQLVYARMESAKHETVGQFTGLKDRNGVRIFEGDIIKTHYANTPKADFIEQVVFHNGRFCGMYERDKMKMWAALPDGIKHLPMDKSVYMEWCEVIGNIHDNPELAEV